MKKITMILLLCAYCFGASAQEQEMQQLVLNIQKLAQLRSILNNMRKGYEIVHSGYNSVKNVTEGNFDLHKTFLDGLMAVSPTVRNYKRLADIFQCQAFILKEYKSAYSSFKANKLLKPGELQYMSTVYANLLNNSAVNLEQLSMVLTANKLRMSDDERLRSIDGIADEMNNKLAFLRYFNTSTKLLLLNRAKEQRELKTVQDIYGLKQ